MQSGVCHAESSEQVSVHTELSSRALIIGYEGRQVVGRGGFKKTRSRQQREPSPPPSFHTPPEAILQAFVDSDLKREALAAAGG